eukprot:CAMPEP_0117429200 /NCGR_PEP_ID=MMETSP0758-20121206/8768_1 /TAXON_ID=63605 /ORGANISM="Percolomonas cosmopolitus, Strain AE-1 (ATCC 50343)" /LENGTH=413 /DNA_ID=CAMNT_0005216039 /DNA_START=224 /DNA_END=1462 /DNA_ORIENTATION=+
MTPKLDVSLEDINIKDSPSPNDNLIIILSYASEYSDIHLFLLLKPIGPSSAFEISASRNSTTDEALQKRISYLESELGEARMVIAKLESTINDLKKENEVLKKSNSKSVLESTSSLNDYNSSLKFKERDDKMSADVEYKQTRVNPEDKIFKESAEPILGEEEAVSSTTVRSVNYHDPFTMFDKQEEKLEKKDENGFKHTPSWSPHNYGCSIKLINKHTVCSTTTRVGSVFASLRFKIPAEEQKLGLPTGSIKNIDDDVERYANLYNDSSNSSSYMSSSLSSTSQYVHSTSSAKMFTSGCHQWSIRIDKTNSGWFYMGINPETLDTDECIGEGRNSYALQTMGGGTIHHGMTYPYTRFKASTGDVITCILDIDKRTLAFNLNNIPLGVAFINLNVGVTYLPCVSITYEGDQLSF